MRWRARSVVTVVAIIAALCRAGPVAAQSWPLRPITLIVAFPPATTVDVAARAIAKDLAESLGQPVLVENRPGGGGIIGTLSVARANPDGYTLLMAGIGPAVLRPLVDRKLAYDPVADLTPIILVGDAVNVLAASPQRGFTNVADVVASAKRPAGGLTIGHSGPGTLNHLIAVLFSAEAGIKSTLISYPGSSPIVADLAGGQIDTGFIAYGAGSSAAKILAVATGERVDFLPGIPTLRESGFPDVVGSTWNAIFAPAGLPAPVAAKLNAAIASFLANDETRKRFHAVGYRVLGGPPERLRAQMADDRARWSKVIESAGGIR
jgi:tripartite-type tricarboxylate transporter receptor subunit TctC